MSPQPAPVLLIKGDGLAGFFFHCPAAIASLKPGDYNWAQFYEPQFHSGMPQEAFDSSAYAMSGIYHQCGMAAINLSKFDADGQTVSPESHLASFGAAASSGTLEFDGGFQRFVNSR